MANKKTAHNIDLMKDLSDDEIAQLQRMIQTGNYKPRRRKT
jgi:hypothetical protein